MRGDPEVEVKRWLEKLSEVNEKRSRFQDMAAEGYLTFEELGAKLADLEETRRLAERELASCRNRQDAIEGLERDRDALLYHYATMLPEALDNLTPEEHHEIYRMLRLQVHINPDASLDIRGVLGEVSLQNGNNIQRERWENGLEHIEIDLRPDAAA